MKGLKVRNPYPFKTKYTEQTNEKEKITGVIVIAEDKLCKITLYFAKDEHGNYFQDKTGRPRAVIARAMMLYGDRLDRKQLYFLRKREEDAIAQIRKEINNNQKKRERS